MPGFVVRTFQIISQLAIDRLLVCNPLLKFLHMHGYPRHCLHKVLSPNAMAGVVDTIKDDILILHLLRSDKSVVLFLSRLALRCAARQVCTDGSLAPF